MLNLRFATVFTGNCITLSTNFTNIPCSTRSPFVRLIALVSTITVNLAQIPTLIVIFCSPYFFCLCARVRTSLREVQYSNIFFQKNPSNSKILILIFKLGKHHAWSTMSYTITSNLSVGKMFHKSTLKSFNMFFFLNIISFPAAR